MTRQEAENHLTIACALSTVVKGTSVIAKIIALRQSKWHRNVPPNLKNKYPLFVRAQDGSEFSLHWDVDTDPDSLLDSAVKSNLVRCR